ncbi:rod shape-determining protein MreC [Orientia chuto str. Dubai]|uniref:Cell shape-determining protein MreC n=1 Tax=Orientia chuto str. Dubai TaxID=1359168 RepID=A0A0F3MN68_9RICK|nr:rod shape-determining protein MreC [Candidatus Orientia mediorientalis]KJV57091.1 rod shape-determining protein MreC [Orientia chuto str. Dubai]
MALLENRYKYQSKNIIKYLLTILTKFRLITVVFILVASIFIVCFSNTQRIKSIILENTGQILETSLSVLNFISNKYTNIAQYYKSLNQLQLDNAELNLRISYLQDVEQKLAISIAENQRLKHFINFREEELSNSITARLLAINSTEYNKLGIISAGLHQGVKKNNIVYDNYGLIGRIIEVSDNYSKVLLLADSNSKIPVISSISQERAIIVGRGSDNYAVTLSYLNENAQVQPEEIFVTSGDGQYYPYGIAVAKVSAINNKNIILTLCSNLNRVEFVRVRL